MPSKPVTSYRSFRNLSNRLTLALLKWSATAVAVEVVVVVVATAAVAAVDGLDLTMLPWVVPAGKQLLTLVRWSNVMLNGFPLHDMGRKHMDMSWPLHTRKLESLRTTAD